MTESGTEVIHGLGLNPDLVIQSIREVEDWRSQFNRILRLDRVGVVSFIEDALKLYQELEEAALNPEVHFPQTAEDASKIKALWVISAPGTYFRARKKDRYEDKEWALWGDRKRINYALKIGRRLAELKMGHQLSNNWVELEREFNADGPLVVYNGTPEEDAALLEAAATPWLRIPESNLYPRDRIFVINPIPPIDNLMDQIKSFRLPSDFKMDPEDEIGVVIHAPQAVRFLYMLNNFSWVIPESMTLRVFPLPTPDTGIPEYPLQEVRGLINYRYMVDPPIVAATPYPCKE